MAISGTLIRGTIHDWSQIEFGINGLEFPNLIEFNYEDELDIGVRRDRAGKVSGTTHGDYEANGDMTLNSQDFEALCEALGDGFGLVFFPVVVNRSDGNGPIITDTMNVRIMGAKSDNKQGNEQSAIQVKLFIQEIVWNGRRLSNKGGAAGPVT